MGSDGHRASLLRGGLKGGLVVFDHLVSHAFFYDLSFESCEARAQSSRLD